ncbi:hypothetical protein Goari_022207, partial [Gossypium aridum]|nr:hypothetical protein [Gossypium aridum]
QGGGGDGVIDVVAKFGVKAGEKTFLTTLDGLSKAPIELQVKGTVKAPVDPSAFKEPKWIAMQKHYFQTFHLSTPGESPNTDGIHIERSDGVNVLNMEIKTGDDCISIWGGSKNLVINGVTCGPGH